MKKQHWINTLAIVSLLVVGLCYEGTHCQAAEKYPSRPIQVVIGYEPGSTDQALRPFIEYMAEYLGQPMNFVFKPGASGSIGAYYVATSKPDGYTIMGASLAPMIISPLTMKGIKYTLDDFVPICRPMVQASGLVVKNDARWKTIKEFVDEAKKNPGKLTYSTSGLYNTNHIPMEMFQKAAGFQCTHIPATGSGPAITALLGGHVDAAFAPMQAIASYLRSGQLRALVFSHTQKVEDFPSVPLLTELGYDITYSGYNALVGPKGMPAEAVQTLIRASDHVMQTRKKEITEHFKRLFSDVDYLTGEALGKAMQADREVTKKIIEELQKSAK